MEKSQLTRLLLPQQVEQKLRAQIAESCQPGQKLDTEVKLAARFGVSIATIREAVTALVREGLVERSPGRGTFVTGHGGRGRIAVLLGAHPSCRHHSFYHAHRTTEGLREFFAEHGMRVETYWPRYLKAGKGTDLEYDEFREDLAQKRLRGVVIVHGPLDSRWNRLIGGCDLPVVGTGCQYSVQMDIGQMIETAVEQMVAQGRKRLAMLCGHDPWEQSDAAREERQRVMDIFANTVASRGARTQADWIRADFRPTSPGAGYSQFREMWTGAAGRPDGLLVLDEVLFSDTATAILEMGIRVPEQLMVVTHSNEGSGILYPFPAARMEFDMEEVARGIGVLLRRAMSHEPIQEPRIKALFRWIDAAPAKRKRLAPENPNQPALHHL